MSDLRKQMRQDMFNSMREVLGDHYVKDYYLQNMADFVSIADWYAKESMKEEKQAIKQRLIDAVERLDKEMPSWIDRMPFDRFLEEIEKIFSDK